MVGRMLVRGWQNVGSWLAECWFVVGRMLAHGWQNVALCVGGLMLGQRVYPTSKVTLAQPHNVAVGPTLNQRLGFGWQMVSVLAGIGLQ